jgi:hypothetical protein
LFTLGGIVKKILEISPLAPKSVEYQMVARYEGEGFGKMLYWFGSLLDRMSLSLILGHPPPPSTIRLVLAAAKSNKFQKTHTHPLPGSVCGFGPFKIDWLFFREQ